MASCDKSVRLAYVAFAGALAVICLLGLPTAASADLRLLKPNPADPATFSGKGGYSTDGLGQNGGGGTVQAQVPAGSTVVQAYLYGTYYFGGAGDPAQRVINFDGTDVTLEQLTYAGPYGCCDLGTARANVTSQVAAKVGGGGGTTNFVIGNDPPALDGVALVVIFSNPALPETTVAVLDGGANTSGDTATFSFASPIDPTAPGFSAEMAVGSGFSFQGVSGNACGGGQVSVIDVNDQRLTNCAGNFDDGELPPAKGVLITVGGVGDSLDNPTPPDDPLTDDELYNLKPFLKTGDTQLKINTLNPDGSDNLFLAVIAVTAQRPPATRCTIRGTSGNDVIRGTSGNDVICAGAGNDIVYGRGGNDVIIGGGGNDVLRGGDGNDRLSGGDGNDVLRGGDGDDRLVGGPGRDVLYGNEGRDFLDTRDNRRGNDVARGGPGGDDCETDRGDVRSSC